MKRVAGIMAVVLVAIVLFSVEGFTQKRKKATTRKKNTKARTTAVANTSLPTENTPVSSADAAAYNDSLLRASLLPAALVSKRPGSTVVGSLIDDKTPIEYENIRVDDQVYKQILWRDIMVSEKMNAKFRYEGEDDNGPGNFFYILLKLIRDGDITAFDAINDRFTAVLPLADIIKSMSGEAQTIQVPDYAADPDGSKGLMRDTTIFNEFDIRTIVGYRIKQEIIFDRESSRMHFRTLGIAPLKQRDFGGQKVFIPTFWVYYPDCRPFFAKREAYNPKNMAMRKSWEEIFDDRDYSSIIYKSTINNSGDKPLSAIVKDPMLRLYEGETIKDNIFNWEQDRWSY